MSSQFWGNLIIETVEKVFFSLDNDWRFTYVNDQAAKALGRSRESLLGKILWEEFPYMLGGKFEKFYRRVMAEKKPDQLEEFSINAYRWYNIQLYPLSQGIIISFQDVTERKQAEQALLKSEASLSSIINSATDAIITLNSEQHIVVFNSAAEKMFGYSAAEVLGKDLAQFLPVRFRQAHSSYIQYFSETGITARVMGHLRPLAAVRKSGEEFPIEATISQVFSNGEKLFTVIIRDITERLQVEQQLRESEERYKILSEASQEGLLLYEEGIVLEANQRVAQMFGYTLKELIGMSVFQLMPPEEHPALAARLATTMTTSIHQKGIGLRRDGSTFFMEASGNEIDYHNKRVRLMSVRDVSELKATEEALHISQNQLLQAQKLESVGRLAGGIAHDFNNLLTIINSYGELVLSEIDPTKDADLHADVSEIVSAAQRAATLTRQLLAFSRQQMLQPQIFNLNDSVAAMDKMLQRLLGEDIELHSIFEPNLGQIEADPGQLEQVIVNLAVNARDAMSEGGKLIIETANIELDESYRVSGLPEVKAGAYVMLAVSDTGSGMDRATQDKIFEPFFTTKEAGKGTGLGLATVYGIVKQSEGYIWVYSEVGIGTTFKIYLPRVTPKDGLDSIKNIAPTAFPHSSVSKTKEVLAGEPAQLEESLATILIVEDVNMLGELIQRVLKGAGYDILHASNGREALNTLLSYDGPLDLVLTDIVMPEMSGRELVRHLKVRWPHLKVMCMSGYTDQAVAQHKILEQCDQFLQKPFTPTTLLERLSTLLATTPTL
jgi:PAS domain S-box-containing protein